MFSMATPSTPATKKPFALSNSPSTMVFGYDYMSLSSIMLSMFPSEQEFGFAPLPDKVISHGPGAVRRLVDGNYPSGMVVDGGYIRDAGLWDKEYVSEPRDSTIYSVLVTPSIDFYDSVELVGKALRAFGSSPEGSKEQSLTSSNFLPHTNATVSIKP